MGRMKRSPLASLAAAAVLLSLTGSALPCSDHEDPAVGRDRLAVNYPGALDILPVVASARRDKLLPPANPMATLWTDKFPLQRHVRAVQKFEVALNSAGQGDAPIVFSMVMIEPMLWTRFAPVDGRAKAAIHTEGAAPGELVLVSAEDVINAIGDGRWSVGEAHAAGLLGLHGTPAEVTQFLARYGNARGAGRAATSVPNPKFAHAFPQPFLRTSDSKGHWKA
jgi:hypothetical protein